MANRLCWPSGAITVQRKPPRRHRSGHPWSRYARTSKRSPTARPERGLSRAPDPPCRCAPVSSSSAPSAQAGVATKIGSLSHVSGRNATVLWSTLVVNCQLHGLARAVFQVKLRMELTGPRMRLSSLPRPESSSPGRRCQLPPDRVCTGGRRAAAPQGRILVPDDRPEHLGARIPPQERLASPMAAVTGSRSQALSCSSDGIGPLRGQEGQPATGPRTCLPGTIRPCEPVVTEALTPLGSYLKYLHTKSDQPRRVRDGSLP
jgi:hypothetical protein